jgi:hypothetical protein
LYASQGLRPEYVSSPQNAQFLKTSLAELSAPKGTHFAQSFCIQTHRIIIKARLKIKMIRYVAFNRKHETKFDVFAFPDAAYICGDQVVVNCIISPTDIIWYKRDPFY